MTTGACTQVGHFVWPSEMYPQSLATTAWSVQGIPGQVQAVPAALATGLKPSQPTWADIRGKLLERRDTIGSSFSTAPPSPDNSTSTAEFRRDSVSSTASVAQNLLADGPPTWLRFEIPEAPVSQEGQGRGTEKDVRKTSKTEVQPHAGKVVVSGPKPSGVARAKSPEARPGGSNQKILVRSKTGVEPTVAARARELVKAKTQQGLAARPRGQSPVSVLRAAPRLVVPPAETKGGAAPTALVFVRDGADYPPVRFAA
ncbi:unnamed protein product [Durusdinium trenchii]|uniref:Uncharacterized protein n=1 Tax=Durusdinium trenchii TaxID=1381693 RepID=A0ABP0S9A0_9DINO